MVEEDDVRLKLLELLAEAGGADLAALMDSLPPKSDQRKIRGLLDKMQIKQLVRKVNVYQLTEDGQRLVEAAIRLRAAFPGKGNHTGIRQKLAAINGPNGAPAEAE